MPFKYGLYLDCFEHLVSLSQFKRISKELAFEIFERDKIVF
jgi:hypothetical protein